LTQAGLPAEFVVPGVPISVQARAGSRQKWRTLVASKAKAAWPSGVSPVAQQVAVTIVYFFPGETTLDVDNIVKPILDSMKGIIYVDDTLVSQVIVRKTRLSSELRLVNPPPVVLSARGEVAEGGFVYVRVGDAPKHEEVPA